ncbi:MAG: lytic transglycosylase domain-containing protein [Acidobacteriota bacterium]|nr:lytic transglycosylase domain-containing protein [Acidobacteriota bacterium]
MASACERSARTAVEALPQLETRAPCRGHGHRQCCASPAKAFHWTVNAALASLAPAAHAAERVTLRNGFSMRCDHHAEADGRMRLYLSVGEDNYIEIPPQEIADVEKIPDLPAHKTAATAPTATTTAPNSDAGLNPADLGEILARAGREHNLDVDLLASVVKAESGGNAHAVSPAGARGLMQLMPGTAAELGVRDSFQPDQNVRGGSAYLDELLTRYHDKLALALAAYNAGPEAVDRYRGIPPYDETRTYVARVIHEFNRRVLAREAEARGTTASAAKQRKNPAP